MPMEIFVQFDAEIAVMTKFHFYNFQALINKWDKLF